jgi:hypothetical protein
MLPGRFSDLSTCSISCLAGLSRHDLSQETPLYNRKKLLTFWNQIRQKQAIRLEIRALLNPGIWQQTLQFIHSVSHHLQSEAAQVQ